MRDAIRLAPDVVRSLGLERVTIDPARLDEIDALVAMPVPRWRGRWTYVPEDASLRHTLEHLAGPGRAQYQKLTADYLSRLEDAIDAWRRIVHRSSDPCPYCDAFSGLDEVVDHLLRCKRHPAVVLAEEAFSALAASLGKAGAEALLKLVQERNDQVDGSAPSSSPATPSTATWAGTVRDPTPAGTWRMR